MTTKPMTDERLAEIRARAERGTAGLWIGEVAADRNDLLIEVDRLRAEADRVRADDELSRAIERQRSAGVVCLRCSNLGFYTVQGKGDCYCACPIGRRMQAYAVGLAEWHDRPEEPADSDEPKGGER